MSRFQACLEKEGHFARLCTPAAIAAEDQADGMDKKQNEDGY